jgi:uncharacterized protein involved in type VI secretion and phage assembly
LIDDLMARLIEKVENRYYGKYRAFVVDNADPEDRGRLRLKVPSVLNDEVISGWALPCVPYGGAANQGFFFIPEVDAGVWVEFEAGNLDYPVWVGTYWGKPGGESEVPKPNDDTGAEEGSVQNPPTRKIIKTLKGHTIQLEDADDKEMILITMITADKPNVIVLDSKGIKITDTNENVVTMHEKGVNLTDLNKNIVTMDDKGINITDKTKNVIEMTDSAFMITSKVDFSIKASGKAIEITGKTIDFKKG